MIIDYAVETLTIIELNCSPMRLDMDWRSWKRARDKGVLCSINPDAHSTMGHHHLGLGIRLARKGWLTERDLLNTQPLKKIEEFLGTPKAKR
jgi:DNA polymerase (family X)